MPEPTAADKRILEHFQRRLAAWEPDCSLEHRRIEENESFMAFSESQWPEADRIRNEMREQPSLSINNIMPVINMVTGTEITGRLRARLYHKHPAEQRAVAIFDEALRQADREADSEHEETTGFRSAFAHGIGCVRSGWDEDEPLGNEMAVSAAPIYELVWDIGARKGNLMDRVGHMHGRWVSTDTYEELYGEEGEELLKQVKAGGAEAETAPESAGSWASIRAGQWYNGDTDMVFMVRYEWRERVTVYDVPVADLTAIEMAAAQVQTGELPPEQFQQMASQVLAAEQVQTLSKSEFKTYADRYEAVVGEPLSVYSKRRPWTWFFAFIVGSRVHKWGEIKANLPTYNFITGIPVSLRTQQRFIGMVDLMKDGQEWRNRAYQLALVMAAHAVKGGLIVEEGMGLDVDALADQLAKPGFVVKLPAAYFDPRRFELVSPDSNALRGLSPLADIAEDATLTPVGLSNTSLGLIPDPRRVSAVTVNSVKQTASLQLQIFMDGVRRFRREAGKLRLSTLMENLDEERLADLVGPEVAYRAVEDPNTGQPAIDPQTGQPQYESMIPPKAEWPKLRRIRLTVDEAPSGPTSAVEFFENMMEHGLGLFYLQTGMIDPELWVDLHPPGWITPEHKDRWVAYLRQRKLAAQQQPPQQAEAQPTA